MGTGHQWWGPWSVSPFKLLAIAGSREPIGVIEREAWPRYVSEGTGDLKMLVRVCSYGICSYNNLIIGDDASWVIHGTGTGLHVSTCSLSHRLGRGVVSPLQKRL